MPVRSHYRRRFYFEHFAITLLSLGLAVLLVATSSTRLLDHLLYDRMLRLKPAGKHSELVIVAIDPVSLREIGPWPWDREQLALLVEKLKAYHSGPVLLDLLLTQPDEGRPASDARLAEAISNHGRVYLPIEVSAQAGSGLPAEVLPLYRFASQARALGHVELRMDDDGVVRSTWLRAGVGEAWWPHVALAMAADLDPAVAEQYRQEQRQRRGMLARVTSFHRYIPFDLAPGDYTRISAADVMAGRAPPVLLAGRTVLVGATAAELGDRMTVSVSGGRDDVAGIEVNAAVLDALLADRLVTPMSHEAHFTLTVVLALLVPLLLPLVPPRWGLAAVLALVAALFLGGYVLLHWGSFWMPLGAPVLVSLVVYPLWTWRRLAYTLNFLQAALLRLSRYTALNRRLAESVSVTPLVRMIERTLPVQAWRLERRGGDVEMGGEAVPERSWQLSRASHFSFVRGRDRYELSVLWNDDQVDPRLHDWLEAMVKRAHQPRLLQRGSYEAVESYLERVAEEEVRQLALTRFFNASLEQLREGIVLCDACGSVLFANRSALQWLQLESQQLEGLHVLDITHGLRWPPKLGSWPELVARALNDGELSLECRREEGTDMLLEVSSVNTGGQPGRVLIVTLKDISDVKQALRTRAEMLDFLSHDLRSPMISLLALAEKMRQSPEGDALKGFLDDIDRYAGKNLNIAEQFLQLARVEALDRIEMDALDMLPVVESAIDQVRPQAQAVRIALRFHYDPRANVWVSGNHELLERLMVNLLTNAIKYSHADTSVDVSLFVEDSWVCCEVRDRGQGIAPELIDHIFEGYTRGKHAAGKIRGAGLGLRFVRLVSERHGGEVRVESRPDEGSRFTLRLPQLAEDLE
jgi:signal transduction histidine kinase